LVEIRAATSVDLQDSNNLLDASVIGPVEFSQWCLHSALSSPMRHFVRVGDISLGGGDLLQVNADTGMQERRAARSVSPYSSAANAVNIVNAVNSIITLRYSACFYLNLWHTDMVSFKIVHCNSL
jgi:hypothetical protein